MDFNVTIITVNLNNKDGLERTIKSVIGQTAFENIEYIVIDGGSTDGSADVIKEHEQYISYWVSEKDNGIYNAMNKGVEHAHGEYCLFLNSGDYLHNSTVIEEVIPHLDSDIVYGGINVHGKNRTYILNDDFFKNKSLPHPAAFTKINLLKQNKFREDFKIISDWIFFYETIYLGGGKCKHLNQIISDFSLGGISSNISACSKEKNRYLASLKAIKLPKIAMCCIGRLENKYAVEFVDFYSKLGVDKFYIYDNNYDGEEWFEEVLQSYIDEGLVEIINFRNQSICQLKAYQHCYDNYGDKYDWVCFFDFDEYLLIDDSKSLKDLLNLEIYKNYDVLHINELIYGDSEKIFYENIPLVERFTQPVQPIDYKKTFNFPENCHVKSIVRGGLESVKWNSTPHTPSNSLKCCNSNGEPCDSRSPFVIPYCHKNVCLRHYKTKTIEEYYNTKVKRGYPDGNKDFFKTHDWAEDFFKENNKTKEKLDFIKSVSNSHYENVLSIIIPCYNQGKYIKETIESVKASTYRDFICIIVNDGSTDNSEEIILNEISGDSRFNYFKNDNHGLPYTRNFGIKQANSKYILCLDSDDKISPTYIENAIKYLNEHNDVALYYGNAKMFYDDGTEKDWRLQEFLYSKLLRFNMIYSSCIYRRKDYERCGGYDENMSGYEDWEFLIRLLYNNDKVYRTDDVVFYYRRHDGSMDTVAKKDIEKYRQYIREKNRDIFSSIQTNSSSGDTLDIFISAHKKFTPIVSKSAYKTINCQNINNDTFNGIKGRFYSEIMSYFYIADNYPLKDYVGFCHYNKYWTFLDDIPNMDELLKDKEMLVAKPLTFKRTIKEQYERCHNIEDLYIVSGILAEKYPDYINVWNKFLNGYIMFPYNMFIMKKDEFLEYIKFMRTILDEFVNVIGKDIDKRIYSNYEKYIKDFSPNDEVWYQFRIAGYLAERLTNAWILKNHNRIGTCAVTITEEKYKKNEQSK